jgi:hypothetical protein
MRRVGGPKRQIKEEGPVGSHRLLVANVADRPVDEVLGEVVGRAVRRRHPFVAGNEIGVPLVRLAAEEAVVAFEAAPKRPIVEGAGGRRLRVGQQMPFPDGHRVVPVRLEDLGKRCGSAADLPEVAGVARGEFRNAPDTNGVVVTAGQEAGSRWRAERRRVEVGVAQAVGGQAVHVGRLDV